MFENRQQLFLVALAFINRTTLNAFPFAITPFAARKLLNLASKLASLLAWNFLANFSSGVRSSKNRSIVSSGYSLARILVIHPATCGHCSPRHSICFLFHPPLADFPLSNSSCVIITIIVTPPMSNLLFTVKSSTHFRRHSLNREKTSTSIHGVCAAPLRPTTPIAVTPHFKVASARLLRGLPMTCHLASQIIAPQSHEIHHEMSTKATESLL